jgi:hypothetical protein
MARRSERGSASQLVLVLAALVGLVGWNYHRNLTAEQREFRPYRSYAEADVAALVEAYEAEEERSGGRYDSAVARRVEARGTGHLMENLNEFERAQAASRRTRDARESLADARASLEVLKREQALRAGERSKLQVFLRRAFTF